MTLFTSNKNYENMSNTTSVPSDDGILQKKMETSDRTLKKSTTTHMNGISQNKPIDINRQKKIMFHELIFSIIVLVFGAIYEHFSFGVYSWYMVYAFAFPLLLIVLPFAVITRFDMEFNISPKGLKLYRYGTATLTIGSIVTGIVEIYGTTNSLTKFYWITGVLLIIIGVVKTCISAKKESTP